MLHEMLSSAPRLHTRNSNCVERERTERVRREKIGEKRKDTKSDVDIEIKMGTNLGVMIDLSLCWHMLMYDNNCLLGINQSWQANYEGKQ